MAWRTSPSIVSQSPPLQFLPTTPALCLTIAMPPEMSDWRRDDSEKMTSGGAANLYASYRVVTAGGLAAISALLKDSCQIVFTSPSKISSPC
ncbi:uncharacterized protein K452DRAFT_282619 [Aplosporella prunicola CBS 121167]|uniref:Uncharacterized protein n=1 Tax=Aplosporella prunicola CBS 121167 TaxID=1176127 RepID=A0A6A6BRN8_9PEZI|nr:uncharacterized protein K452DRAFT_282619 [Aplosporella prunicola CBS 121167]KAF2146448.1 hypothetical protein K452DRAFT_282619 [Aplosporella prunicola CBS 121167]